MSLLKCPECNKEVSEYAEACPNCGCPINVIKSSQPISKKEGHFYSIINGEEKDITYFVKKSLSDEWINDIVGFKTKMQNELDIYDVFDFIKAIKDCNGAPKEYNDEKASIHYEKLNKIKASLPKCPYCHSTSIKKISAASRTASVIGFGIFSKKIGKQWHCNNCGSDF